MMILLSAAAGLVSAPATSAQPATCRAAQLGLHVAASPGAAAGGSASAATLTIRNMGRDCLMPALPTMELRDGGGRVLPASRRLPFGMHPGPVVLPIRLGGGHAAVAVLRWISQPAHGDGRRLVASGVAVRLGAAVVATPFKVMILAPRGTPFQFDQSPFKIVEGMAADL